MDTQFQQFTNMLKTSNTQYDTEVTDGYTVVRIEQEAGRFTEGRFTEFVFNSSGDLVEVV